VKIGQYLANIWTKYDSLLFFGPPCICTYNALSAFPQSPNYSYCNNSQTVHITTQGGMIVGCLQVGGKERERRESNGRGMARKWKTSWLRRYAPNNNNLMLNKQNIVFFVENCYEYTNNINRQKRAYPHYSVRVGHMKFNRK